MSEQNEQPQGHVEKSLINLANILARLFTAVTLPEGGLWKDQLPSSKELYKDGLFISSEDLKYIVNQFISEMFDLLKEWEEVVYNLESMDHSDLPKLLKQKHDVKAQIQEQLLSIIYFVSRYIFYFFDQNKEINVFFWQSSIREAIWRLKIISGLPNIADGKINNLNCTELIVIALLISKIFLWAIASCIDPVPPLYDEIDKLIKALDVLHQTDKELQQQGFGLDNSTPFLDLFSKLDSDPLRLLFAAEAWVIGVTLTDSYPIVIDAYGNIKKVNKLIEYYKEFIPFLLKEYSLTPRQQSDGKLILERLSGLLQYMENPSNQN